MPDYKGDIRFMGNGKIFDLGGREIEVLETPGHTPGSITIEGIFGLNRMVNNNGFRMTYINRE